MRGACRKTPPPPPPPPPPGHRRLAAASAYKGKGLPTSRSARRRGWCPRSAGRGHAWNRPGYFARHARCLFQGWRAARVVTAGWTGVRVRVGNVENFSKRNRAAGLFCILGEGRPGQGRRCHAGQLRLCSLGGQKKETRTHRTTPQIGSFSRMHRMHARVGPHGRLSDARPRMRAPMKLRKGDKTSRVWHAVRSVCISKRKPDGPHARTHARTHRCFPRLHGACHVTAPAALVVR